MEVSVRAIRMVGIAVRIVPRAAVLHSCRERVQVGEAVRHRQRVLYVGEVDGYIGAGSVAVSGEKEFVTPPLSLSKDEGVFAQAVNRPVVCPSAGLGRSSERDEP